MAAGSPLALTFDDGPGPSTERLLDVLGEHGAHATLFCLGRNLRGEALDGDGDRAVAIAARAVREGHALGNHTMSHAFALSEPELLAELAACDALVAACYRSAGADAPAAPAVRLPFGAARRDLPVSLGTLARIGRPHHHWTASFGDWRPERDARELADAMVSHAIAMWQDGRVPILLLHDAGQGAGDDGAAYGVVRDATVAAVAQFCARLAPRGLRYLTATGSGADTLPWP
ncbi:MAG TPA: polysaccharide deacetylase family protein [Kofleriaceae bacterium]|nr:polysaccharide deacetylase family protein [Kofleriaceae bacterium]